MIASRKIKFSRCVHAPHRLLVVFAPGNKNQDRGFIDQLSQVRQAQDDAGLGQSLLSWES